MALICEFLILGLFFAAVVADCPNGFLRHNNFCYSFPNLAVTWSDARVYCESMGAHLAVIHNEDEDNFLVGHVQRSPGAFVTNNFWLNGGDFLAENEWMWLDTLSPLEYSNWKPGEPNDDHEGGEHCLELDGRAGVYDWNDASCVDNISNFICQRDYDSSGIVG